MVDQIKSKKQDYLPDNVQNHIANNARMSENRTDGKAKIKHTELQKKGFAIAKKYKDLPLQDRLGFIAEAFGCKTAKVSAISRNGMYRGYKELFITFDNKAKLYIGIERASNAKKQSVISEYVNKTLAKYNPEIVKEAKELALAALEKRAIEDNAIAEREGLKPYKLLNVELNNGSHLPRYAHIGYYYIAIEFENKILGFTESLLNAEITKGRVSESISETNYLISEGLKKEDVDLVFNNIGFSSAKKVHHVEPSSIITIMPIKIS